MVKLIFLFQFFFDGVVSIASMLEVAVFYLAQNPDLQEKAFEEIQVETLQMLKIWKCVQTIIRCSNFLQSLFFKIVFCGGVALSSGIYQGFLLQGSTD